MIFLPQLYSVSKHFGFKRTIQHITLSQRWLLTSEKDMPRTVSGEAYFKKRDGIGSEYELIYKPQHNELLIIGKAATTISVSLFPILLSGYALEHFYLKNHAFFGSLLEAPTAETWTAAFMFFNINLMLLLTCNTMPLRIYKHDKKYVAIMPGLIPTINKKLYFNKGEIQEHFSRNTRWKNLLYQYTDKIFGNKLTFDMAYKINGKKVMMSQKNFRRPLDLFEIFADTSKYVEKPQ